MRDHGINPLPFFKWLFFFFYVNLKHMFSHRLLSGKIDIKNIDCGVSTTYIFHKRYTSPPEGSSVEWWTTSGLAMSVLKSPRCWGRIICTTPGKTCVSSDYIKTCFVPIYCFRTVIMNLQEIILHKLVIAFENALVILQIEKQMTKR